MNRIEQRDAETDIGKAGAEIRMHQMGMADVGSHSPQRPPEQIEPVAFGGTIDMQIFRHNAQSQEAIRDHPVFRGRFQDRQRHLMAAAHQLLRKIQDDPFGTPRSQLRQHLQNLHFNFIPVLICDFIKSMLH